MHLSLLVVTVAMFCAGGFYMGRGRAVAAAGNRIGVLNSLPSYHGAYVAIWSGLSALVVLAAWVALEPVFIRTIVINEIPNAGDIDPSRLELIYGTIYNLATGGIISGTPTDDVRRAADVYAGLKATADLSKTVVVLAVAIISCVFAFSRLSAQFRARQHVELIFNIILVVCSTMAILTTVGIIVSLVFDAVRFFTHVSIWDFLFGLHWSPQRMDVPLENGGVDSSAFGAIPIFWGTIFISFIAMCVAVPIGLFAAIYMSEYASNTMRTFVKPILEVLAGVPTVVYGFFAALVVAPNIKNWGIWDWIGVGVSPESALAAGVVMGVMIIPFVSSLSDDVINAVPQSLRDGSYGLGATKSETIRGVILPAALPGIVGAIMLAISRAVGETMIVVMAAGLSASLTANPLESVTTVTVQIVKLLTGDQAFGSPKTLSAFALGLVLFLVTLILNMIAVQVVQKYREQYD